MTRTAQIRPVLLPLDGSEVAEQALPVAAFLAREAGVALHLVTVEEPLSPLVSATEYGGQAPELLKQDSERLKDYLEHARVAAKAAGVSAVDTALLVGGASVALAEHIRGSRIGLVVMTTHGRTGISRFWLGSVADRLLRTVSVPVLLLRPRATPQATSYRRILVALDGELEKEVLDAAWAIADLMPEPPALTLLRVVEPPLPGLTRLAVQPAHLGSDWTRRREIEAREYLARLADRLRFAGRAVSTRVLVGRPVHDQILEAAAEMAADLIVLGTHGARGLERLMLGSVADKVVRNSALPLLVAPVVRRARRARPGRRSAGIAAASPTR
jgi:nucleotide-binding universal stress UspA family protein